MEEIARAASEHGVRIAVAESLTCGRLVHALGRGSDAATWLRGCVVAYATEVKQDLLGVTPGPVVSDRCAEEMAAGVARVLGADVAVATTGVGGPDPEEGEQPGVVHIATWSARGTTSRRFEFEADDPAEVLDAATDAALEMLAAALVDVVAAQPRGSETVA